MSTTGEISGVMLEYVLRRVEGKVMTSIVKFDPDLGENVRKEVAIRHPVIVFFPNRTSRVMSEKDAERAGFMRQPEIMNFAQVADQRTPAGRYKNAIRSADRKQAWLEMEVTLINRIIEKSGHPLALENTYSQSSVYLDDPTEEIAA